MLYISHLSTNTSHLQTSVAVGDIQEVRQNALLRQRELHVSLFFNPLGWPSIKDV